MGSWTLGADNATVRNVPEPGPGSIQARRAIPQLGPIRCDPLRRQVDLPRPRRFKAEQRLRDNYSYNVSYTLSTSTDDASSPGSDGVGNQRAAERSQHLRRDRRVGAFELRPPSPVRGERDVSAPVLRRRGGLQKGVAGGLADQRRVLGAVGRAVHGEPRRGSGEHRSGPAQRPDQSTDPNLPSGKRPPSDGSTRRHLRCRRRSRSAARRATASSVRVFNLDLVLAKTWTVAGTRSWSCDGRYSTR